MTSVRRPRHLRTRVTLTASFVTFSILTLSAFAMIAFQQRQLFDAVDASLQESVLEIQQDLRITFGRFDSRRSRSPQPPDLDQRVARSNRSMQLIDSDGDVLVSGGDLAGETALVDTEEVLDDTNETIGEFATVEGEHSRYRIAAADLGEGRVLVAGYSLADVDESLETQRRALMIAIPLLSGLLGLLIWLVLGRALKPVEAIREEVAGISGSDLDRRVPIPGSSVELASLATTMNDMLDRLDDSATRQSRFVSDAAHELRSPLAGIRGQLEVNIHHPDAPDRVRSEQEMLTEAIRMQDLIDQLLLLARADHGTLEVSAVEVDLDDLVLDEAAQLRRSTDLDIRFDAVSAARVQGDPAQLRRVIRNLADNAVRHATHRVSFELGEEADGIRLVVADDGPGLRAGDVESIFDRFTRLDESRDRDAGGTGLGLAICREIVSLHGGTIDVVPSDGGARFEVLLPHP